MRVLFVGNPADNPTAGGAWSFQQTLMTGLQQMETPHECWYVHPVPGQGLAQRWVEEQRIDFVWFVARYHEPVDTAFAITIWDQGHRQLPYFPELSVSGWTWDERDAFYGHVLPRASFVVIGNEVGAQSVHDFYRVPRENIRCIPLPVDATPLRDLVAEPEVPQSLGLTPGQYLLYPAQFWPHKNHVTLVDMLGILRSRGRDLKLVFTGSDKGNRAYVESYVAQHGLQDSVVFAGFIETPVLHQLYLNAFATVYASLLGPDNLPPIESMALGCPVVCAAYLGAREQLGDAALFFDGVEAEQAADQVLALEDPAVRAGLIAAGRSVVDGRTPELYIHRINELLDEFAKKRKLWGFRFVHA